jgi:hypothetical protein
MLLKNLPKIVKQMLEPENTSIAVKAKNFFLVSDGSTAGTYVEMNGKKVELLQSLTINWDAKNSIPTINMTSYLLPEKQNDMEDLSKITKAFKNEQEIFDINVPILDFEERYIFGHWIIYKRTNEKCYTFVLTDRFHYGLDLNSIADSVKYQSVVTKYLMDMFIPIFKDAGIPIVKFESSKNIETIYQNRSFDLFSEDLKIGEPILFNKDHYTDIEIKIFHDLPKDKYITDQIVLKNDMKEKLIKTWKVIHEFFKTKNISEIQELILLPIYYNSGYAFDISFMIPSCSILDDFFTDAHSIVANNLNLNEGQKNMLSQEYLRFLNRIL